MLAPLILIIASIHSSSTLAKNLSNQFINSDAIVQDNNGFIWLATTNGLIRYDSENSIIINSNNKNWPLPFNWINDIHLVDNDKLLLATETHKLWLFDTTNGSATPLATDLEHHNSVYQVIEHQGKYYLNVPNKLSNKLYSVDPLLQKSQLLADKIFIKSLQHTQKNVYISTPDAVFKLQDDNLKEVETGKISTISAAGSTLLIAKGDQLIAVSDNNKRIIRSLKSPISAITSSHDMRSIFTLDKAGNIHQYKLTDLTEMLHSYPKIASASVDKIFHDNTGVLWVLSNLGIKKITQSIAKNYPKVFNVKFNAIALTVHQDQLVLGSYGGGLGVLSDHSNFLPKNINDKLTSNGKVITDLYSTGSIIYIATFDGLWQFDPIAQTVKRVNFPNNNMLLLSMRYKDGALYLATNNDGLIKYNIANSRVEYHIKSETLSSGEVIDALPLADNKLWLATSTGINIVDTQTKLVTQIDSFGENKVISLLEYKDKVFVSTKGDGFFIFNLQGELLSHIAKNTNFSYMSFINGEIWISGRPGLYRLNPDTYQLKMVANTEQYSFTKKPVLLNNKVYVGHYGGVIEVPLKAKDTVHAKIFISKTITSGKAELLSTAINIDSPNDLVTLQLASLDFRPGQEKKYKYQINGSHWNDINGSQLTLTELSSGEYHIEIMGTNSLGQWSDFKAYADINVSYPWYWHPNSQIFYATIMTSLIIITFWLLYLRSRSISRIHKTLSDELNSHSQSTSIIRRKLLKIQSLIEPSIESQTADKSSNTEATSPYVQSLIRECLDELSTQNSHAAPSSLSGSSLTVALPYLVDYFHHQYHVLLTLHLNIEDSEANYAIQSAIYRIIYEAILAAITNGNGGVFEVHVNRTSEKIWLKITNNEQSFAQFNSKINFDMAMYYIRQVANKFNATFHTYDNQEHGSEIILSIPLRKIS